VIPALRNNGTEQPKADREAKFRQQYPTRWVGHQKDEEGFPLSRERRSLEWAAAGADETSAAHKKDEEGFSFSRERRSPEWAAAGADEMSAAHKNKDRPLLSG